MNGYSQDTCLSLDCTLNQIYTITKLISSSELSHVYLCKRENDLKPYVIKEFYPKSLVLRDLDNKTVLSRKPSFQGKVEELHQLFLQEANLLKELRHPNIVSYIDHFSENGTSFLVTEYSEGETLESVIRNSLPTKDKRLLLQTLAQVIEAVRYCHKSGVIHRDIKPSNILVQADGTPILIDFGSAYRVNLAKTADSTHRQNFTTKGYSPLEFYSEKAEQGRFSDIYSLSATLYYCFTGQPPLDVSERMIVDEMVSIRKNGDNINSILSWLILRGLSVDPKKRLSSAWFLQLGLTIELAINQFTKKRKGASTATIEASSIDEKM